MIPDEDWSTIVDSTPIPSIDLIPIRFTEDNNREFLLGRRKNKPAQNTWFVPGGRILKNELAQNAIHRVARQELGLSVEVIEELGQYEHFYDSSDTGSETGKHYIPLAYSVSVDGMFGSVMEDKSQHSSVQWFSKPPKNTHKYTITYLDDAGLL